MSEEVKSTAEQLTKIYLKIKDRRSELSAAFKEEDSKLSEQISDSTKRT